MARSRKVVGPLMVAMALVACGGQTAPSAGDGAPDAAADGERSPECPATPPAVGSPCNVTGLECTYTAEEEKCGTYDCPSVGAWTTSGVGMRCLLSAELVCPSRKAALVVGEAPIDRSCAADGDCVSVLVQIDCCGTKLGYGVSTGSASAAIDAASTCRRTFPGCGCPEAAPIPETELPDGGIANDIEAYCDAGTCRTRYVLP